MPTGWLKVIETASEVDRVAPIFRTWRETNMTRRNAPILATATLAILLPACSASVGVNDDSAGQDATASTDAKSTYAENGVSIRRARPRRPAATSSGPRGLDPTRLDRMS